MTMMPDLDINLKNSRIIWIVQKLCLSLRQIKENMKKVFVTIISILLPIIANANTQELNSGTFNAIETPLTFEAVSGTVTVTVNNYYASLTPTIQYRVDDGDWTYLELWHNQHNASPRYANAIPAGKIVQIRASEWYPCYFPQNDGFDISCDADCYVYGNVSSVNGLDYASSISGAPSHLFYKNTHIKNHPEKELYLGKYCDRYAFYGCTNLTSITFPSNVTGIYEKAFGNCTKITDVTCLAEKVPSTDAAAFAGSSIGEATLYVPKSAINDYKNTIPWSNFGKIVAYDDINPTPVPVPTPEPTPRCATPTISIKDGKLVFDCETEGVKYHYQIIMPESQESIGNQIPLPTTVTIKVYASKENYLDSEVATKDMGLLLGLKGDMNDDGVIDAADIVNLVNVIMTKKVEDEEPEIIIIDSEW